ncbi:MAG: hypothetical protein WA110_09660 [Anaerolineaceae bacterium]
MTAQFNRKQQRLGLIYGLVAGVVFAFTAWGIDAIKLSNAHIAYPFMKFLPGLIICVLTGCLVGWASIRIGKTWVALLLWLLFAVLLVWLMIYLPIKGNAALIKQFQPNLSGFIEYPMVANVEQFRIIGMIALGLPCLLCGFFESHLVDQALASSSSMGTITMILVCALLMSGAGFGADDLINKHFREPVQVLDQLFEFALKNDGKEVEKTIARRMHLSVVEDLADLLHNPRQLTLIAYDSMLGQVDILVNFGGSWVRCTAIYSQPTRCDPVHELSLKQYLAAIDPGFKIFEEKLK